MVYDDADNEKYRIFDISLLNVGEHKITFDKHGIIDYFDRIFLSGNFDVEVFTKNDEQKCVISYYNLEINVAGENKVILSKRRNKLDVCQSWAIQGQPFYSGKITYTFNYDFDKTGKYRLDLKNVRDIAEVFVCGKPVGRKIYPPYTFDFYTESGLKEIKVATTNSLGNEMECYLEESGILNGMTIQTK